MTTHRLTPARLSGSAQRVSITYSSANVSGTCTRYTVLLGSQRDTCIMMVTTRRRANNQQSAAQAGATSSQLLHAPMGAARSAASVCQENLSHQRWHCMTMTRTTEVQVVSAKSTSVDQRAYGAKVAAQRTQAQLSMIYCKLYCDAQAAKSLSLNMNSTVGKLAQGAVVQTLQGAYAGMLRSVREQPAKPSSV